MGLNIYKHNSANMFDENTYLVIDEDSGDAMLIDPGTFNGDIEKQLSNATLKYIILTHAHLDHICELPRYRKDYPEAKLIMHEDDSDLLESEELNSTARVFGKGVTDRADIYADDKSDICLGNHRLSFIHTPGHTKGGMCILIDNHLFTGDTLFWRTVGRTDLYGGDWDTLKNSIQKKLFILRDDITVYPGHGENTSIGEEKRANPFV